MPRFVAALYDPDNPGAARRATAGAASLRAADARWRTALAGDGVTLLTWDRADAFPTHELPEGGGAVFGVLFRGAGVSAPLRSLDEIAPERIRETEGASLVTSVWGGYVAFVKGAAPGRWSILRDPSGFIPVHHVHHAGVHLVFSDVPDALAFDPFPLGVRWPVLTASALDLYCYGRDMAIAGVTRLSPGDRLTLDTRSAATSVTGCWRPVDVVSARRIDDPDQAAEALYAAVLDGVRSWSSVYGDVVSLLSGGIDTSIVVGALGETGAKDVTCLNFFTEAERPPVGLLDGRGALRGDLSYLGDERVYARSMARKWGYRLVEARRGVEKMDLGLLAAAPLTPRPTASIVCLDVYPIFREVVEETGARAIFGGEGGDSVFFGIPDLLPALDAIAHYGVSRRTLAAMRDAAKLSRTSIWHVLAAAARWRWSGAWTPKGMREEAQRAMLTDPDAIPSWRERARQTSWCEPRGAMPPGKEWHAFNMQFTMGYWRGDPLAHYADFVEPLLSQPVVETCLQIPTYTLIRRGVRRGLARATFARLLSPEVNGRRQKGTALNLQQQLVLTNLPFVREALLEGEMVRAGVLDRTKLEAALASEARLRRDDSLYLLNFLAAELWLQAFERERRKLAGARRVA